MTRATFLPFHKPDLDGSEMEAVREVLDSGWLTTGNKARQFEAAFASFVGAKHALALNSCTAALHLALEAIGLGKGDLVLTSPYTFASTAEVVRYFDAVPVFVDIQPDTLNLDPLRLDSTLAMLPKMPKAIIPVDIAGHPCDLDPINQFARRNNITVIEDAAHTLPTRYHGRMVGSLADFTCFSFYATKTLTTGEGGMLTTEDDEKAERCRIMSMHGISRNAWKRYSEQGSWYYEIVAPGFKYNMTDIAAAIGLSQLRKVEAMWERRQQIAAQYTAAFSSYEQLQTPRIEAEIEHAWHLYILRLNLDTLAINRDEFVEALKERNIGVSVHFIPLHVHPYYAQTYRYKASDFPVAYQQYQRVISLPIYSGMTDQDVQDVIRVVTEIAETNRAGKVFPVDIPASQALLK